MLDVGLSSTDRIAAFFGIAPAAREEAEQRARPAPGRRAGKARAAPRPEPVSGVQATIERALKAAGLMR